MRWRHEHPLLARLATGLFCFVFSLVVRTALVAGARFTANDRAPGMTASWDSEM